MDGKSALEGDSTDSHGLLPCHGPIVGIGTSFSGAYRKTTHFSLAIPELALGRQVVQQ